MSPPGGFAQSRSPELHLVKLVWTWTRFLARRSNAFTTGIAREIRREGRKEARTRATSTSVTGHQSQKRDRLFGMKTQLASLLEDDSWRSCLLQRDPHNCAASVSE